MKLITTHDQQNLEAAIRRFLQARRIVALTGAGISVESGIDDFRSPGGIWSIYPPEEYGTLSAFRRAPEKSWKLFTALWKGLEGKQPNRAHRVLATLERCDLLEGIVTQNIDNLHQLAGSKNVLEIHGNHQHLQCLKCGEVSHPPADLFTAKDLPTCPQCNSIVKPNVVLFGENVRCMEEIDELVANCDLLMVIGTSAQVYPAAGIPEQVKMRGGMIYEFNIEETSLTAACSHLGNRAGFLFLGKASIMLGMLLDSIRFHRDCS